jgi:hypothetical protein
MRKDSEPSTKPVSGAPTAPANADRSRAHKAHVDHALADLRDGEAQGSPTKADAAKSSARTD